MGGVASSEVRTQEVALDAVSQHHRRSPGERGGCGVGGIDLVEVVATAGQLPDPLVGPIGHHRSRARIPIEEVLTDVGTVIGLVGLVVAIGGDVHQIDQGTIGVGGEQRIPAATPHDFDHIPAGPAEEALQLLHDLAVAADRSVQALQIAVDDEGQVVQTLVGGQLQGTAAFHLIHLTVTEEGPHPLLGSVLDTAVGQILVELGLIDGVDRPQTHRHRRELPEARHLMRVRIGRQRPYLSVNEVALLLAEAVQIKLAEASFQEGSRIHARTGVALEEDLIAATGMVLAAEEMVEAHLVQRRGGGIGGDVTAHTHTGTLGAMNHDRGIPAHQTSEATLQIHVAGIGRLDVGGNGVDVVGGGKRRQVEMLGARLFQQLEHHIACAVQSVGVDHGIQGRQPLRGFLGVGVGQVRRQSVRDHFD